MLHDDSPSTRTESATRHRAGGGLSTVVDPHSPRPHRWCAAVATGSPTYAARSRVTRL
jgi:hypothetical protein